MMDIHTQVPAGEFNATLWKRFHEGKIRNVYPLAKYNDIVQKIKTIELNPPCNQPGEYYLLRKFVVVTIDGQERLSCKPENHHTSDNNQNASKPKFYVALEEIHKYIDDVHRSIKHGGRDRIVRNLQSQGIVNITRDTVELFLSFCKVCRPRRKDHSRRNNKRPMSPLVHSDKSCDSPLSNETNSTEHLRNSQITDTLKFDLNQNRSFDAVCSFTRGYVDLLNFSSMPDGDYRFVFLYLDIQTCFSILAPVRCKCIHEVVSNLLNIFTLIGPPQVLHSSFSDHFLYSVIQDLKQSWPEVVIVIGSSNYTELQEVAQNCVAEVDRMLKSWMTDNSSSQWSRGLKFIQLRKNTKLVGNSIKSPYECFFGHSLSGDNFPSNVDATLLTHATREDDLLTLINQQKNAQPCEKLQVSVDPNICALVQNGSDESVESLVSERELIVKSEIMSDVEEPVSNGIEFSDSSNDTSSQHDGNLQIIIKKELEDS